MLTKREIRLGKSRPCTGLLRRTLVTSRKMRYQLGARPVESRSLAHARSTKAGCTLAVRRFLWDAMEQWRNADANGGVAEAGRHFNPPGAIISWGGGAVTVEKYEVRWGLPPM